MKRVHHELLVWQEAIALVGEVYKLTKFFPAEEIYGLTAQLRRAAVSVPSNIAEGAGRGANKEFLYYLRVARGSLCEVETQLFIAEKLDYIKESGQIMQQLNKVFGLLGGLMNSIKNKA